jgi:hypothetical protein
MHAAIELLETYGLIRDLDSLRIAEFNSNKTLRLNERLYSVIFDQQQTIPKTSTTIDPFSFLASASLRGQSTCSSYDCRIAKFDFLARYAALYANRVMFPLPLKHPSKATVGADVADELSYSVLMLLQLRPLVDAGLIVPVVMRSMHCVHTKKWATTMIELVRSVSDDAAFELQKHFRVVYQSAEKSPTGQEFINIEGPEDFLEHGGGVLLVDDPKSWVSPKAKFDARGRLEIRGRKKLSAIRWVFDQIANDTTFYLAYGRTHDARFLTDRPGETLLLDWVTADKEVSASSTAMNAYLTHSLPLLGDISIASLLRIRRDERDSFLRYRSALQIMLNEIAVRKKRIGKQEIQELYNERIEPELLRMKSELHQEQRRQRRRLIGGVGTLAATVALGAFGGIVPILAKASMIAAGSMVGGRLLSKAAEAKCEHGATLAEKNDFYFLLRVSQDAERN